MSVRPRIFISAVSSEFRSTRQTVANILARLGYEPVVQEIFGTEAGDLRAMLREKIDACQGLVQIVGDAYGYAPPTDDPEFGPVSYTQYEFLYARKTGKKTWLIFAAPECQRNTDLDQLDLPTDNRFPDPFAEQQPRRKLQQAYRARLEQSDHLFHLAENDTRLELVVERLKDELKEIQIEVQRSQRRVGQILLTVLILLVATGSGVAWSIRQQPASTSFTTLKLVNNLRWHGMCISPVLERRFAQVTTILSARRRV